ncbi:AAA family ATPase [Aurantiacibacter sp. MUD61]|uniref:AAA family ATPase n=1 Tax=Aurantiacibacter sp. MUD61 TaxID=3009083 RepID=UPI003FA4B89C
MIIYLTGSPASGKTTIAERLAEREHCLVHFRFGRVLTELIQQNCTSGQHAHRCTPQSPHHACDRARNAANALRSGLAI